MPLKINSKIPSQITFKNRSKNIVNLNRKNVFEVEAVISKDPRFQLDLESRFYDYHSNNNGGNFPFGSKDAVLDVVLMIDLVNSTQKYQKGYINVLNAIADYISSQAATFVQDLQQKDLNLVDHLVAYVEGITTRHEVSLCSKVCRFFSNKLFPLNDLFYAWDSKVRDALPYYSDYFGVQLANRPWKTYIDFHKDIELFRNDICPNLSRIELDHLLWFCHR